MNKTWDWNGQALVASVNVKICRSLLEKQVCNPAGQALSRPRQGAGQSWR